MARTRRETYDAIVVGSGMSGGWAAKELCEGGLKTLVLERGRPLEHGSYPTEWKQPWEFPFRGGAVPPEEVRQHYPVQSKTYAFLEETKHYFIRDSEHPYVQSRPYTWIRANTVGGRSVLWARQCYRLSPMDFEANAKEGVGIDWPIRYDDLAPWYDYVEAVVGISGEALGLAHLPDSRFLPPMEMNAVEKVFREKIHDAFPERNVTIGRVANLTQSLPGRAACQYRNQCWRGCSFGAYFSSVSVTLPLAAATGNLTIRPNSAVHSVVYDAQRDRASGVRVIDTVSKEETVYEARLIFLCASAMETARIMLNSTSSRFPTGIANSSGALGHYLMDHHYHVGADGDFEGHEDRYYVGNRANGIYIPRFRNISPTTRTPDYLRGFGFQGSAQRASWRRGSEGPGIGAALKSALRDPGPWSISIGGFGETLPRYENACEIDPEVVDSWGIPNLRFQVTRDDNDLAMRRDIAFSAAEMLEAAGAVNVRTYDHIEDAPGLGNHEMGSARMGRDPATSVLNGTNQCHDVPNLFVTDGACMTSASCVNPSLTYMALTARACDFAIEELKRRNL